MLERRGSKEEAVMVGKGSPKLNVMAGGSPKLRRFVPTTRATKKKPSSKCNGARRSGGSPRGMAFNVSSCFLVNFVFNAMKFIADACPLFL
jgi:hypothetical protein